MAWHPAKTDMIVIDPLLFDKKIPPTISPGFPMQLVPPYDKHRFLGTCMLSRNLYM